MPKCRFFPWCSYIEGHGCTDDWCEHYQPMPDVDALLRIADEIERDVAIADHYNLRMKTASVGRYAERIREALGVES